MIELKTISEIHSDIKTYSPQPDEVKLLAVSKMQPVDKILNLASQGQKYFGENYVQEALDKQKQIAIPIHWHFIGHIQSNKIKFLVGKFDLIHSVGSFKTASLIDQKAKALGIVQKVLLEINLAQESTKSGFSSESLLTEWSQLSLLDHIKIMGFMALPPQSTDANQTRGYFIKLRELRDHYKKMTDLTIHPLNELSMGTSHDYIVALQEQATLIRLGTVLFGERN